MKRNLSSIRDAVIAVGVLCGAIMVPAISHATGAVTLNTNSTVCSSNATMTLTPSGDMNIVCAVSTVPVCSVSASSTSLSVNGQATVTANCNPAATGYTWTLGGTAGGPAISGGFQTLTFPTAGTFTYSVTGSNTAGAGAASAALSIVVSNGGPTTAPVCTASASPSTIIQGGTSSITASCNPAAASYTWTTTGPAMPNTGSAVLTFPSTGTFSYSVVGTNSIGSGAASQSASVTVSPAGSCVAKAVAGAYTGNSTKLIAIDRGSSVTYSLPVYSTPGRIIEMLSIQSTASQSDLTSEFSISTCPGDFDNMQAECKTWGTVNTSGTQLDAIVWGTPYPGTCTMISGQQYYINVRNTKYDKVTPACNVQTCYMNVQLNSY